MPTSTTPTATLIPSPATTNITTTPQKIPSASSSSSPSNHSSYPSNTQSNTPTATSHINYPHPSTLTPVSASKTDSGSKQPLAVGLGSPSSVDEDHLSVTSATADDGLFDITSSRSVLPCSPSCFVSTSTALYQYPLFYINIH